MITYSQKPRKCLIH